MKLKLFFVLMTALKFVDAFTLELVTRGKNHNLICEGKCRALKQLHTRITFYVVFVVYLWSLFITNVFVFFPLILWILYLHCCSGHLESIVLSATSSIVIIWRNPIKGHRKNQPCAGGQKRLWAINKTSWLVILIRMSAAAPSCSSMKWVFTDKAQCVPIFHFAKNWINSTSR